jgi:hypothetical protein
MKAVTIKDEPKKTKGAALAASFVLFQSFGRI